MTIADTKSSIVKSFVEPMNKATENFLRKANLRDTDYLFLWMSSDGKKFCADLHCITRKNAGIKTQADAGPLYASVEIDVPERFEETPRWPGLSYSAQSFFNRIPEKKHLDRMTYERRYYHEIAATDITALLIDHVWEADQLQFRPPGLTDDGEWKYPEDEDAQLLYRYLLERFFGQTIRARQIAEFKNDGSLPSEPKGWIERNDRPLADYQKLAAWIGPCGAVNMALFLDRGTGKTAIGVAAMCHIGRESRISQVPRTIEVPVNGGGQNLTVKNGKMVATEQIMVPGPMIHVLIICPGQVRTNWQLEIERFATVAGKATIIKGTALDRVKLLVQSLTDEDDCAFSAAIISYDSAASVTSEQLMRVPWDLVILDESHKYKSSSTKRWGAINELKDVAKRMMPMTGTPIGNTPMDLWTQLESLGEGLSGFTKFSAFREFYGQWSEVGGNAPRGIEKLTGLRNIPLLQERLARCSLQITKKEAGLKLPDKLYDYYEVEWSNYHRELYARVEKEIELEIKSTLSGEVNNLTVNNILTQLLRLAQITSGHLRYDPKLDEEGNVLEEGRVEQVVNPNPKVEGVIEMLTDEDRDPLGKTIVWCCFVPDIVVLMENLAARGIDAVSYYGATTEADREIAVKRFNEDPFCRVMVCNPQCAGEGLNLVGYDWQNDEPKQPTYTDHEIFFSCNWSALDRGQAEDRAHRRGTRSVVRITDLVIPGTIDVEIRERVRGKIAIAGATLDISAILSAVLGVDYKEE